MRVIFFHTFCMEIDPKTLFGRKFRYLPAFLMIFYVIFALRLIDYNKKCTTVQRNLGFWVKFDKIFTELTTASASFPTGWANQKVFEILQKHRLCSALVQNTKKNSLQISQKFGNLPQIHQPHPSPAV